MRHGATIAGRFKNVQLRAKLMLAFLAIALLIGVSGGSGLIFVRQIGQIVGIFSEVASPLLDDSAEPHETMLKTHAALLDALGRSDQRKIDEFKATIAELNATAQKRLNALEELSKREKLNLDTDDAATKQSEFAVNANEALKAHAEKLEKEALAATRLRDFENERQNLDSALGEFARQSEVTMAEREDAGKTLVQSNAATVDDLDKILSETFNQSYPVVLAAYKSMRYLMQLQDNARACVNEHDLERLPAIEEAARASIKALNSQLRHVTGRVQTKEEKELHDKISRGLSQLEAELLADDGLFAVYRRSLAAKGEAEALKNSLAKTIESYQQTLHTVAAAASSLSNGAKNAVRATISYAQNAVALIVALGLTAGMLGGFFFSRSITGPLVCLTHVMSALAKGDLRVKIPAKERGDEIGAMAAAVEVFKDNTIEKQRLEAEQAKEHQARNCRVERFEALTHTFERNVAAALQAMGFLDSACKCNV